MFWEASVQTSVEGERGRRASRLWVSLGFVVISIFITIIQETFITVPP